MTYGAGALWAMLPMLVIWGIATRTPRFREAYAAQLQAQVCRSLPKKLHPTVTQLHTP